MSEATEPFAELVCECEFCARVDEDSRAHVLAFLRAQGVTLDAATPRAGHSTTLHVCRDRWRLFVWELLRSTNLSRVLQVSDAHETPEDVVARVRDWEYLSPTVDDVPTGWSMMPAGNIGRVGGDRGAAVWFSRHLGWCWDASWRLAHGPVFASGSWLHSWRAAVETVDRVLGIDTQWPAEAS